MADLDARPLLMTDTVSVWDVVCPGTCRHKSAEERVTATRLVFSYRGVYPRPTWSVRAGKACDFRGEVAGVGRFALVCG